MFIAFQLRMGVSGQVLQSVKEHPRFPRRVSVVVIVYSHATGSFGPVAPKAPQLVLSAALLLRLLNGWVRAVAEGLGRWT